MNTLRTAVAAPMIIALSLGLASCGNSDAEGTKTPAAESHEEGEKAHDDEKEGGHAEGSKEEAAERVAIPVESAKASGIVVSAAAAGSINETISLTGRIMLQPTARAEVRAPYSGPVRAVLKNVGDTVRRGETLARVESAESLQTYSVAAPISGVVLERQTNVGDVTGETSLYVIGDLTKLQAELNVAARDIGRVASGQNVEITGLDGATSVSGRVASVLPTADLQSQTLIARVPIATSSNSPLRPGMAVRGAVAISQAPAALVVSRDAVQTVEGKQVVFVRVSADTYEARPVTLGRKGAGVVEILTGVTAGESYVSENAFLVKAEIGKGSASHDH